MDQQPRSVSRLLLPLHGGRHGCGGGGESPCSDGVGGGGDDNLLTWGGTVVGVVDWLGVFDISISHIYYRYMDTVINSSGW